MPDTSKEILKQRLDQMKSAKILPDFEDLYFAIAHDLGFLNDFMADYIINIQARKSLIMDDGVKSVAEFERQFEMSE